RSAMYAAHLRVSTFFVLARRPALRSTLFPYTTLFRSAAAPVALHNVSCRPSLRKIVPVRVAPGGCPRRIPPMDSTALVAQNDLPDRKSTRLNSSHVSISYAVFCLKKKKK